MRLSWLGHSGFRIEIEDQVILLDPWLGNPLFDAARRGEAIAGATRILITHGHFDHIADTVAIAQELAIPVVGIFDMITFWEQKHGVTGIGFNKGGTVRLGNVAVTMVNATHSSSWAGPDGPVYAGTESGYMIAGEGRTIYVSGDTDVMADMALFEELHHPEIGILCAGGHFTMDMKRAGFAAKKFFHFRTVVPCHYRTFPLLEQNADALKAALPGVDVIEPEILQPIEL
ncbi:metal-dependent hydrolase [Amaricoccus sp.]|uniref:metal-dependent hydrolase n=1 Tax=Amaricoccus sp. TaxID=1872485 RepID=UPI002611C502|nr:metal-dependent hydrolase [Amaricoccus sp.]HRO12510.1 metal-dependent hydrolase [Amaricoccus sp.]